MTLSEFLAKLLQQYPKCTYRLRIDAECSRTPAYQRTSFGKTLHEPEETQSKATYSLTFTLDYFDKASRRQEENFQAPSLDALWQTLLATYQDKGRQTVQELEGWLKAQ